VTRQGKNVTIRERETSLDCENEDQVWDMEIDKRVKKAMYLCDEHNISQQSYRALYHHLDGTGPTAHAVDQGRKSMNAKIEEKVPLHSHSGEGDEPRPTVYCSVKKFLLALIDAQRCSCLLIRYTDSHTHTHTHRYTDNNNTKQN
jgi:hypothetical protein